ncbi:MAG: CHAD domain-containing protein [Pseudonocardia sp.]|nr:CHAD domain-containing protein [Pseudonocardia sp.]
MTKAARARKGLRAGVDRSTRRLDRAVTAATDPRTPPAEPAAAVHAARKAGKRLRYATEVAGTKPRHLKAFQKALGEHQDTVVSRAALRELGAAAHATGENGFSFGILLGLDAARAEQIERELPRLWARR